LASESVATVSTGLASKPAATISSGLASKPVATISPGLISKSVVDFFWFGRQNRQLRFDDLCLKTTAMISWFVPQDRTCFGLLVAP
jgi:hypothetical protein